jgi:hypothetical protein
MTSKKPTKRVISNIITSIDHFDDLLFSSLNGEHPKKACELLYNKLMEAAEGSKHKESLIVALYYDEGDLVVDLVEKRIQTDEESERV